GKSTVTVNLATALTRLGKKDGIIDADIYGFSVPEMMGVEEMPVVRGEKIIPAERFGVKLISMGFFVVVTMISLHDGSSSCNEIIVTTPHPTAAFVAARAGQMAL